jgi:hypothetical protein
MLKRGGDTLLITLLLVVILSYNGRSIPCCLSLGYGGACGVEESGCGSGSGAGSPSFVSVRHSVMASWAGRLDKRTNLFD